MSSSFQYLPSYDTIMISVKHESRNIPVADLYLQCRVRGKTDKKRKTIIRLIIIFFF